MKQIKLTFIIALVLSLVTATVCAQTLPPRLVVWQKNGEKVYFKLAEKPETTFDNGLLLITTSSMSVSYQLSDILRYTYEGVSDAVELLPNERSVSISDDGSTVAFKGLSRGVVACLYSTDGKLLEQQKADGSRTVSFSVKNRPRGIYVVKTGTETVKLLKR